ncbi:MAG TPA: hypothetical protein VNL71_14600 [Chloroflexota bacterium]|nr:hypothetical protein [Chloroflexota bacterium]
MGWETRARGGRYYTQSRRVGGRVVREYIGTGTLAEAAAFLARCERERLTDERAARLAYRQQYAVLDAPLAEFCDHVAELTNGALVAAGYHQHKREWRKRRGKTEACPTGTE